MEAFFAVVISLLFLFFVLRRDSTVEKDQPKPKILRETPEQFDERVRRIEIAQRQASWRHPFNTSWRVKPVSLKPLRLGRNLDNHFRKNVKDWKNSHPNSAFDENSFSYKGRRVHKLRDATITNWRTRDSGVACSLDEIRIEQEAETQIEDGLKYERIAFRYLSEQLQASRLREKAFLSRHPTIRYLDANGEGFARPDMVMIIERRLETVSGRKKIAIIFESKLTFTPSAWRQMSDLYFPLLSHIYNRHLMIGVQVFLRRGFFTGPAFTGAFMPYVEKIAANADAFPKTSLYAWHLHTLE